MVVAVEGMLQRSVIYETVEKGGGSCAGRVYSGSAVIRATGH